MATSSARRTLIACTDLSRNSLPALKQAAWLAATLDYAVQLVFVVDPLSVLDKGKRTTNQGEQLREWANTQLKLLQEKIFTGITAEASLIELNEQAWWSELTKPFDNHAIAQAICEKAKHSQADVVVLGTHGHAGLSELVLGTVATRVMKLAHCDVLTVRPTESEQSDAPLDLEHLPTSPAPKKLQHILCPIDFSECSRLALGRAVHLAQASNATVHIMHSYRVPFWMGPGSNDMAHQLSDQVKQSMEEAAQHYANSGILFQCHVALGRPPMAIRTLAQELNIDAIVMGTLGQTALNELLIGSVTERAVRMAPCPVLAVRNR